MKRRQIYSFKAQSGSDLELGKAALGARTIRDARSLLSGTLRAVFDVTSLEELEALDEVSVAERILTACYWSLPPRVGRGQLVGVVHRSESEAFAVIELREAARSPSAEFSYKYPLIGVMTLVRVGNSWLSLLNGGLAIDARHPISFGALSSSAYRWVPGASYRSG